MRSLTAGTRRGPATPAAGLCRALPPQALPSRQAPSLPLPFRAGSGMAAAVPAAGGAPAAALPGLVLVHVTVPSRDAGRAIADALVAEHLAACVNLVPGLESVYRWEGRVQRDAEELLLIKSRAALVPRLAARVRELHPYEECEVLAVPVAGGSESYLRWVADATSPAAAAACAARYKSCGGSDGGRVGAGTRAPDSTDGNTAGYRSPCSCIANCK